MLMVFSDGEVQDNIGLVYDGITTMMGGWVILDTRH